MSIDPRTVEILRQTTRVNSNRKNKMIQARVKWGILGTSMISATMAKAIRESTSGELFAIGSRALESAQSFASEYTIPNYYGNFNQLIENPDVDVVYIGLPINHCILIKLTP
jgi:hypothetical protein